MKVALITGITGQDGSYLTELLLAKEYIVYGIVRRSSSINTNRIDHLFHHEKLILRYGDLTDSSGLLGLLHEIKSKNPEMKRLEIYNLGAMSHVKVSFDVPEYTADADALGTLRLLNAIRSCGLQDITRFYQASTSEMFGKVQEVPQKETTPFYPRSPYGVAKLYSHWITKNYRESYDMFACSGILFNHESKRRGPTFVTRKITIAANKIKAGLQDRLVLGNLSASRDWGYAGDYVKAMHLMLQQEKPDDYVIATGKAYTVEDFLKKTFEYLDLGDYKDYVDFDPKFLRPQEVPCLLGDASKAKENLNWKPEIDLDGLVKMMCDSDTKGYK